MSPIASQTAAVVRRPFYQHLYFQVLVAIVLGGAIGHFWPTFGESLKPLGDAFIKLVKMVIAPVIFLTIVTGIAGMRDIGRVGRVAAKAFGYFLVFSTLALIVGLIVANVVRPGHGLNIDPATLDKGAVAQYAQAAHESTIVGFLTGIIPDTVVSAFSTGNILQVLFVSILFGIALAMIGDLGKPVMTFLESVSAAFFKLVAILMKAAPIGAFG
ncbi:MAG TPA: C4-dicarboxylate transporter DctA, partial [Brevundimonas sp.]|nr:C4-dicarboxylate transporter DctA [Brevundimonas sp.]